MNNIVYLGILYSEPCYTPNEAYAKIVNDFQSLEEVTRIRSSTLAVNK